MLLPNPSEVGNGLGGGGERGGVFGRGVFLRSVSDFVLCLSLGLDLLPATAVADITSATAAEREYMQKYSDFSPVKNSSTGAMEKGFLSGAKRGTTVASEGDRIVFDWSGYTIGYFGRPFEMKGGVKGGAFESDGEYSRAVIGENTIARGIELAMIGMRR